MSAADDRVRLTVVFSGNVQGVGFRYTAQGIAERHPVTGYVRNLPDGRVELVAEGGRSDVCAFVDAVEQSMGRHIRDSQKVESPGTGEFNRFSIRT